MGLLKRIFWDTDDANVKYDNESLSPELSESAQNIEREIVNYNPDNLTANKQKQSIFVENLKSKGKTKTTTLKKKEQRNEKEEEEERIEEF